MLNNDNSLILAAACVWGGGTGWDLGYTHLCSRSPCAEQFL